MARAVGAGAGDQRVGLRDLLSASRGLVAEACDIIRSVQREREDAGAAGRQKIQAELKDPSDDRTYLTIADTRAQRHILAGLRARFGTALDIVGDRGGGGGGGRRRPRRAADSRRILPCLLPPPALCRAAGQCQTTTWTCSARRPATLMLASATR